MNIKGFFLYFWSVTTFYVSAAIINALRDRSLLPSELRLTLLCLLLLYFGVYYERVSILSALREAKRNKENGSGWRRNSGMNEPKD